MACSKLFSFAEVVQGRDASVRVTEDGLLYAVDLVMVMTGKDRNNSGRDLRDLPDETFPSTNFVDRKLPGKGYGHTKLVSFEHALELIMVLPGKVAKETRKAFASQWTSNKILTNTSFNPNEKSHSYQENGLLNPPYPGLGARASHFATPYA